MSDSKYLPNKARNTPCENHTTNGHLLQKLDFWTNQNWNMPCVVHADSGVQLQHALIDLY